MLDAALELLPHAPVGFVGVTRDEETLRPVPYYLKLPDGLTGRSVLVLDPMLATGDRPRRDRLCREAGASDITLAALIAAPEGIARCARSSPTRISASRRSTSGSTTSASSSPAWATRATACTGRSGARALRRRCSSRPRVGARGGRGHRARDDERRADGRARRGGARDDDRARRRRLRAGHDRWPQRRAGAEISLAGEPGATIAGMSITGGQRIAVSNLAIAPAGAPRS